MTAWDSADLEQEEPAVGLMVPLGREQRIGTTGQPHLIHLLAFVAPPLPLPPPLPALHVAGAALQPAALAISWQAPVAAPAAGRQAGERGWGVGPACTWVEGLAARGAGLLP